VSELLLDSAGQTEALGAALYRALAPRAGAVIYLEGPLGAGKTTLARGLLRAAGITGSVRSPTYTLLEPYELAGRTLLHMDLYRLNAPAELAQLGLADFPPDQNWWLVEWPERGTGVLPDPDVRIVLEHLPEGRRARLSGVAIPAGLT
jgi:tRNA threonylcarbamoyladenosine biosynthesis protein TsaE